MEERKYTSDGLLVVSELFKCPLWERSLETRGLNCSEDCYFCRYSDFRKLEYIQKQEESPQRGVLYSVCHNEKNRRND